MSSMMPLGRLFNASVSVTTANTRYSLRDCSGITFMLVGATSGAITVQEANAASGGTAQTLAGSFVYYTQNNGVWTQQAASTLGGAGVSATTGGLLAIYIPQGALSDGFSYLSASHATGTFVPVFSDLDVQRKPQNLRDVRV